MPLRQHILAFCFASFAAASAQAGDPSKQECVSANEAGQDLRHAGKLRDARAKFAICVSQTCPPAVRQDCVQRLDDVNKSLPTIVFAAKDGKGNDLTTVRITVDGVTLTDELDVGRALTLDPGPHVFRFEADGLPSVEKKLVIREAEKDRREQIVLDTASAPAVSTHHAAEDSSGPLRVPAILAFSAGGVGLLVGLIFTAAWLGEPCGPGDCSTDPGSPGRARAYSAGMGIGFAAAGVGAAIGTVLLLTSPGAPAKATATGVEPRIGLGWAGIGGTF